MLGFNSRTIIQKLDSIQESLAGSALTLKSYANFEEELGITGLNDFMNAPPRAFLKNAPEDIYEFQFRAIPAWGDICRRLQSFATPTTAYVLLVTRWPQHHANWEIEGLNFTHGPGADDTIVIASDYGERTDLSPKHYIWEKLRGGFHYEGQYGVFIAALPPNDAFGLFGEKGNWPRLKDNVRLAPEQLIGLTAKPTPQELVLLNQVLRTYWSTLQKRFGYRAQHRYGFGTGKGQNPFIDDLPETLVLDSTRNDPQTILPEEVIFKTWAGISASNLLESWHAASKIARIMQAHRDLLHPLSLQPRPPRSNRCPGVHRI